MEQIMRYVDLRSDTVTKPTPDMRKAMADAEVGDDVFGEDPTVRRLEQKVAGLCGMEAALFVASGTMGNQIALKVHTHPGDEVILDENCHILNYEGGGPGLISGVQIRALPGKKGILTAKQIEAVLRPENVHFARQTLICLENTHNRGGGSVYPLAWMKEISELARSNGIRIHLDGARLWNASVASGVALDEYGSLFDSMNLCFSKGLGAPVGSILVGSKEFIHEARRVRKVLGGGMRQVGILAAAALYAIEHHWPLLKEDHRRAKELAKFIHSFPHVQINPKDVETNILIFDWTHPTVSTAELEQRLEKKGVRCLAISATRIRMVFHLQVNDDDLKYVKQMFEQVMDEIGQ
jgi:threonine aldolase